MDTNKENFELLRNTRIFGKVMPSVEYAWLNSEPPELTNLSNVYGRQFYVYASDFKIIGHGRTQEDADELVKARHPDLKNYEKFLCNFRLKPPVFVLMEPGEIERSPKTEAEYKREGRELEGYMRQKLTKAITFSKCVEGAQKSFVESQESEPHESLGRITNAISRELIEVPELSQQFKADLMGILIADYRRELGI
jgi:hypothetical protein